MRRAAVASAVVSLLVVVQLFAGTAVDDGSFGAAARIRGMFASLRSAVTMSGNSFATREDAGGATGTDATTLAFTPSRRRAVLPPGSNGPRANDDAYTVLRGKTLTVNAAAGVLANDTDPQGKPLTATLLTSTAHGTLTLHADGSFTYVNDGSSAASDSFTYQASNGTTASGPATVTIRISAGDPPVAAPDGFSVNQGATLTVSAPGVLGNDTLNGATITSYGASSGTEQTTLSVNTPTSQGGTVRLNADGSLVYNAANGFSGADTFKYVLTNQAGSSTATVTITVNATPPLASPDSFSTARGTALNAPAPGVLSNDTLNGGSIVSYGVTGTEQNTVGASTATAQGGTVSLNANGSFVYNPAAPFTGADTFRYVLRNAGGSSTATVSITVQAPAGPDFVVASPGFFYTFTGVSGQNPVLTLQRGRTYTFQINTSPVHPFEILGAPAGTVTNNNISVGTITFAVPLAAVNYAYDCSIHGFGNVITTTP